MKKKKIHKTPGETLNEAKVMIMSISYLQKVKRAMRLII